MLKKQFTKTTIKELKNMQWHKKRLVNLCIYLMIQMNNEGVGMYRYEASSTDHLTPIWKNRSPNKPPQIRQWYFHIGDFNNHSCANFWSKGVNFDIVDKNKSSFSNEWLDELDAWFDKKDSDKLDEMENTVATNEIHAGRGWNNTRKDILESVLAQLQQ
jgi:hypothetical protein